MGTARKINSSSGNNRAVGNIVFEVVLFAMLISDDRAGFFCVQRNRVTLAPLFLLQCAGVTFVHCV
jgi:hypothetical protein